MMDKIRMHQQIYIYSKGAVTMVRLSDMIGEEKVNRALRNFLTNNRYPEKPASSDLLKGFYKMSQDASVRKKSKSCLNLNNIKSSRSGRV